MTPAFLAPLFFWFLALIPVVILLYLLKLRRTEVVISSTYLWIKSLQDLTANAPFQRLRKNLLLLLQILAIAALVVALARPFVRAEGGQGANYCVIIDNSASMQTLEGGKSRLELARGEALEIADTLESDDKMMVVAFSESADILCELTDDKFRLRRAVNSIQPADTRTNIRDVMLVARSLAPDNPDIPSVVNNLKLVLLSDGKLSDVDEIGARAIDMSYIRVGATRDNAGITNFSVRRPTEGKGDQQSFVLVHNESGTELKTTLSLYFDDNLLAVEEVTVPAASDQEALFSHPDLGEGVLRAELDLADALTADNRAWLAMRPSTKLKTLVVTNGESTSGYYLKKALALEPRVELSAVEPAAFSGDGAYDITIFDGFAPPSLPQGSLVFVNAAPPIEGFAFGENIERPPVLSTEPDHPAMRFLDPTNVGIRRARRMELPEGARAVTSTTGSPLIADVSRGGQQILVLGFDIAESDWPLNLSFPLFLQNVVSWAPRAALAGEMSIATGQPISILPVPGVESATVTTPDGREETVQLDPLRPVYFGGTKRAGVYEVLRGDERIRIAVNLLDRNESAVDPAGEIQFGRGAVTAQEGPLKQTRELWRWFVLAALAVLAAEWWVYSRRAWT